MKKIFLVILMLFSFCLVGCDTQKPQNNYDNDMFVRVMKADSYEVVYNIETKVMYTISSGIYNCGTFTLLVNADGTPMIYEEG